VADRKAVERAAFLKKMPLSTTGDIPAYRIVAHCGLVAAECVTGISNWSEFVASINDAFGGRGTKFEAEMKRLRESAIAELRHAADAAGGDAVVGVRFEYSEIGTGKGMSMMLLAALGTAVKAEPWEVVPE